MPILVKTSDGTVSLDKDSIALKHDGTVKQLSQGFVHVDGAWQALFGSTFDYPRWGYARFAGASLSENGYMGPQSFIEENLISFFDNFDSGNLISYAIPDGETFAYFAHPARLGNAVFTDTGNNFQGAWDGAKWREDLSNFEDKGPVEVEFDAGNGPELWYVYRTDWQGPSSANFRVDFV